MANKKAKNASGPPSSKFAGHHGENTKKDVPATDVGKKANDEPDKASAIELAMLAAMLNPRGCCSGYARDALLHAMALFEESAALCRDLGPKDCMERINFLGDDAMLGQNGAGHLFRVLADSISNVPPPVLVLASDGHGGDTLRSYLQNHCNLEGRNGRKSWAGVRTVRDNLKTWFVYLANLDNSRNAAGIRARDERDAKEALERGCSVEEIRSGRSGQFVYDHEQWEDADKMFEEFLSRHELIENGQTVGYAIPQKIVDRFIGWKRWIRTQKGGIKAIHPLMRQEVLFGQAKKKIPKKLN